MSKTITNKKKSGAKSVLAIIAAILVVIIVGGVVVTYNIIDSGFIQRNQVAMSSENYEVTSAMMTYYFNSLYQNYTSSYSSMLESMGLDTSKSLKDQKYTEDQTWYDYFMESTKSQVQQLLILAEAAKAENFTLESDDSHDHGSSIDDTLATMKTMATAYGVTLDYYISAVYGASVNEKVLRECMELSELASHYSDHMIEGYEYDEADWKEYYEKNPNSFNKVNYLSYTFEVKKQEVKKDATDDEKAAAAALDKAEAERLLNEANTLAATTDEKAFKTYVESYLRNDLYKGKTEEDLKKDKVDIASLVEKTLTEGATNSTENDLNKWLFDKERKAFETHVEKDEKALKYTAYMILPAADSDLGLACIYRDSYVLKDYRYIPFLASDYKNSDKDAKAAAEKVLEEYKETATEDKFIALADPEKGYGDGNYEGGLVEGADKTTIAAEVGTWAFDSARKEGDVEIVKVEGKGYYLVYFCGDNNVKWQLQADNYLINEQYSADIVKLEKTYTVKAYSKGTGLVDDIIIGDTSSSSSSK